MTIYSFYIFDRHCTVVYYHDWHRSPLKMVRPGPGVLPRVSAAVSPMKESNQKKPVHTDFTRQQSSMGIFPFNNPTGVVVGGEEIPSHLQTLVSSSSLKNSVASVDNHQTRSISSKSETLVDHQPSKNQALVFDEEAKLVYGAVFSLRNMVQKLAGRQEPLHSYTTSTYTLHILTTPTNHTFLLFTSPMSESMKPVLKNLWRTSWLDFVVRNPLVSIDSRTSGKGIDNEMFRRSVDNQIRSLPVFN